MAPRYVSGNCKNDCKALGRIGNVGTVIIGGYDIYDNYQEEGSFGEKTQEATINAVGGFAGAYAGAEIGASVGGFIGGFFGGVGAVPGAIIGGIIGGIVGGIYGGDILKTIDADDALKYAVDKFND